MYFALNVRTAPCSSRIHARSGALMHVSLRQINRAVRVPDLALIKERNGWILLSASVVHRPFDPGPVYTLSLEIDRHAGGHAARVLRLLRPRPRQRGGDRAA